ncbi:MAG: FAD-dependent oxidoreductase, partial [Bdellovibrionota bacterium]
MHIYDYIIIGSGLTGLAIAKKISQETDNILILEAQELSGGDNRAALLGNQIINNGLRFYPDTEASRKALTFLEDLLGKKLSSISSENNIETFESSGFKRFVGFGEKSPEFYQQLSYFLSQKELNLELNPHHWTQELAESLQTKIQKKSIVTKFGFEGLADQDSTNAQPKLTHVIVNGSKHIYAHNFIFAGAAKDLGLLLPDEVLPARAKAKLKKSLAYQGVCLDLFHTQSSDKSNIFLLNGTTDDDIGPCIGRFLPASESIPQTQISQWMSFIDSEVAEDTENIGLVLKKMKRQIKRAFPELLASVKKERIFVTPALSGADLKLNANGTLPKVSNLWIASNQVSPYQNLLGSLMQARFVLSSLGFVSDVEAL